MLKSHIRMDKTLICLLLLSMLGLSVQDFLEDGFKDILDHTVWGQCPVPEVCRSKCVIDVDCSSVSAGPSIPLFKYYVINPREWKFNFSNNYIMDISDNAFFYPANGNYYPMNLTELDLSHNRIEYISPRAFRGGATKILRILDLSYNKIQELRWGVFNDMPVLVTLDLSHNQIMSVDSLCAAPFPSLTTLNLDNNNITHIQDSCFSAYPSIGCNGVSFNKNSIWSTPNCALPNNCQFRSVGNPIICPCASESCIKPGGHNETSIESQNSVDLNSCPRTGVCKNITLMFDYPYKENGCLLKKDMFMAKGLWNSTDEVDSFSISLYKVRYVTDSVTNETSITLFTEDTFSEPALNFTSVEYELGVNEKWLLCVKETGGLSSTCKNMKVPNEWEVGRCNGAVSHVPATSILIILTFFLLAKFLI